MWLVTTTLVAVAPIERGMFHVQRNFLSPDELALLRGHLLHNASRYMSTLAEKRDSYPRGKHLLDFGGIRRKTPHQLPPELLTTVQGAFDRAHTATLAMEWSSSVFDTRRSKASSVQHISWHPRGSDFPPHVDYAPACVAVLIYVSGTDTGDFEGGQLQARGCPGVMACPTTRREYNLNVSERLACTVQHEHHPRAGDMVALLAETAHAVAVVTVSRSHDASDHGPRARPAPSHTERFLAAGLACPGSTLQRPSCAAWRTSPARLHRLVALPPSRASAACQVKSGMRIALNSWLDCGGRGRLRNSCRRTKDLATCHKAKLESCDAHQPTRPAEDGSAGDDG